MRLTGLPDLRRAGGGVETLPVEGQQNMTIEHAIVGPVSTGEGGAMKSDINPMHSAPRCTAHTKRTGLPCKAPAVTGWSVCRVYAAGGGAPVGKRNGHYRHDGRTTEADQVTPPVLCEELRN